MQSTDIQNSTVTQAQINELMVEHVLTWDLVHWRGTGHSKEEIYGLCVCVCVCVCVCTQDANNMVNLSVRAKST